MNEIVKYTAEGLENFQVRIDEDTVWLTPAQMVELFERDQSVISRHINNVFKEKELERDSNMHFLHITNVDKPIVQHPASKKELENMETRLSRQLDEIRQELENSEIIADTQFGEIYHTLIQLTTKKDIEEKTRRRIGFKPNYE
jgi:long-subunit acyl-CoA synthetase (AMP-forming)